MRDREREGVGGGGGGGGGGERYPEAEKDVVVVFWLLYVPATY